MKIIEKEINLRAEKDALQFRRTYDLGTSDPIDMDSLLLKLGITTLFTTLSSSFSGMAAKVNNSRFLLVNCSQTKGRQNFTIAHELYHLFIQEDFSFEIHMNNINSAIEKQADRFSSELLLPESGIKEILTDKVYLSKKLTIGHIIKLEQYFKVSRAAILNRLKALSLLTKNEYEEFNSYYVKDSAKAYGYSLELYESSEPKFISKDYFEKAKTLYDNELIGLNDFATLIADIGLDIFELQNFTHKK